LSGDDRSALTVAYYVDGTFADNVEYTLKDTPCGDVVGKTVCCFPKEVCTLYPKDELLHELCAESYIGTTLWSSENKPIGLIAVIGRKPLIRPELAESMLRLVSLRAAAELEQRIAAAALKEANAELERKVRKRTEDLQKSHDLLEELSRQVPGVIYQFRLSPDGQYCIPYASAALSDVFELSPEDVRDTAVPFFARIHPDYVDTLFHSSQTSARLLTPWEDEFLVQLPRKGLRWIGGVSRPERTQDGSIIWHGFATDVTERKLIEQALLEKSALFNEAQRQANIGSWHWSVDTGEVSWSEQLYTITGRDSRQGCIEYEDQEQMYATESWSRLDTAVKQALATGEPYELELELIRADLSRRICIAKGEVVLDKDGAVSGLRGTVQDVTERVQLERQLFQAKQLESIGHLVAGVAHEVRNPLNAILLISEALFRETEIEGNETYTPYITHIRTQVNRLARLMNDLLELGKPIAPSCLLPVHLHNLCCETIDLWSNSGAAHKLPVLLAAETEVSEMSVVADPCKLQQAMFNLLENAAQHSPVGSEIKITLSEQMLNGPIARVASIRIADEGCGIQENKIQQIFEPFFSTRIEGTGLGLSLVKHFIENMGGSVRVWNNNPLPGCTVELCVPLSVKEHI